MSKVTGFVYCLAVSFSCVYAGEEDEPTPTIDFIASRQECGKEYGISDAEFLEAVKSGDISKINSCYFACCYKKVGILNDKGQYDMNTYMANLKKILKDDSVYYAKFKEEVDQCKSVKDKAVSDGEAGCEMAALLAACIMGYEKRLFKNNTGT